MEISFAYIFSGQIIIRLVGIQPDECHSRERHPWPRWSNQESRDCSIFVSIDYSSLKGLFVSQWKN